MTRSNGIGQEQEIQEYVHVLGESQEPLKSDFGNAHERGPDSPFNRDANRQASVQESAIRFVPTRVHGAMDYPMALLTMASPWLFGFSKRTMMPHLVLGVLDVISGVTVQTRPSREHRQG